MPPAVVDPELFGVTESSVTVSFVVEEGGVPVEAAARVRIDGEVRALSEGSAGTRVARVDGLAPGAVHRIEIEIGGSAAAPDAYLPERFETLPAPEADAVATFATLNDLHFGEPRFGGMLLDDGDYGDEAPGFPSARADDTEVPYWRFMNEDAVSDINAAGVDAVVIKGDIADRGLPEQFEVAAETFAGFDAPHHAFLGNHDHYALNEGQTVDGYGLLGQDPAPRTVETGGWRLVLLDSVEPGKHHGVFPEERLRWLEEALAESRERAAPTLLFLHHQPVPPKYAYSYPNSIGLRPEHSLPFFDLVGSCPEVRGVLIGHTHRNRVRRYPEAGDAVFAEVNCTKDYPGGFGHYRLFEDGSFRQEVRRTSSERALAHSTRCRDFFRGGYRDFALGKLADRCYVAGRSR